MAEANWYVAHTYSGYENKVKANIEKTIENRHLEDQILEVRVPMQDVTELKNGAQKLVSRKMFPGYVLINMVMNDDTWYVVRNTRGVTGFVGPGSKPVPLEEEEMSRFGIHQENIVYDFEIGVFLCNNGLYGGQGLWTYEDRLAVAKTGLRAWIFDAEQDFNNIDYVEEQIKAFKEAGYSDQWIAENLRLTCFPSELFYYWGESDHSTTRINYWYFGDGEIYYGSDCHIDENGQLVYDSKVMPGGTYTVEARGASRSGTKEGHAYTVYGENFQEWALETT